MKNIEKCKILNNVKFFSFKNKNNTMMKPKDRPYSTPSDP